MTWWETEEMAKYISDVETRLDEWSMSNSEMRFERQAIERVNNKINQSLSETSDSDKKIFLTHLVNRIESLREHLTERLKRDVPCS